MSWILLYYKMHLNMRLHNLQNPQPMHWQKNILHYSNNKHLTSVFRLLQEEHPK